MVWTIYCHTSNWYYHEECIWYEYLHDLYYVLYSLTCIEYQKRFFFYLGLWTDPNSSKKWTFPWCKATQHDKWMIHVYVWNICHDIISQSPPPPTPSWPYLFVYLHVHMKKLNPKGSIGSLSRHGQRIIFSWELATLPGTSITIGLTHKDCLYNMLMKRLYSSCLNAKKQNQSERNYHT